MKQINSLFKTDYKGSKWTKELTVDDYLTDEMTFEQSKNTALVESLIEYDSNPNRTFKGGFTTSDNKSKASRSDLETLLIEVIKLETKSVNSISAFSIRSKFDLVKLPDILIPSFAKSS